MSFGFSPSDIITLINLTTKTYQGWKNACGEYADITSMLDGLCILLGRIRDEADKPGSVLARNDAEREELRGVLRGCRRTVEELDTVVLRFKSLSKSRKKNWDRLRFGVKNLSELRAKLTQYTTIITAYLEAVGLGSLGRIEESLNAIPIDILRGIDGLAAQIRAGTREGSVMTTYEDDEKDVWRQFRRELVSDNIKSSTIRQHKPRIRQYLRKLAEQGALEEEEPPIDQPERADTPVRQCSTSRVSGAANITSDESISDSDGPEARYVTKSASPASGRSQQNSVTNEHTSETIDDPARPRESQHPSYGDIRHGLDHEAPLRAKLHRNVVFSREMVQPGPGGYVVQWTLPLRPAVADHHRLLSRYERYSDRIKYTHPEQCEEVVQYYRRREAAGRFAFLERQIPWLPEREPEDRSTLEILLPPCWTYVMHDSRIFFAKREPFRSCNIVFPRCEVRLPNLFDESAPVPHGWTVEQDIYGCIQWRHCISNTAVNYHPAEYLDIEPGPPRRFDHMRPVTGAPLMASVPLNLSNIAPIASNQELPTTMSAGAMIPELSPRYSRLKRISREVLRLTWTENLQRANPGMREHLIEWQERANNIAGRHPETEHLVVSRSQYERSAAERENKSDQRLAGFRLRTYYAIDHYRLSIISPDFYPAAGIMKKCEFQLHDRLYTLSLLSDLHKPHATHGMEGEDEVSQRWFFVHAAEVLSQLQFLLGCGPRAMPAYSRDDYTAQPQPDVCRLAFACFFASEPAQPFHPDDARHASVRGNLGHRNHDDLWGAVASFIGNLYGFVIYHPGGSCGRDGFVMWVDLAHCSRATRAGLECKTFLLQRTSLPPERAPQSGLTDWLGHVVLYD